MKEKVISSINESTHFAIQLDETTDCSGDSQLMVYARYRGSDEIEEEMLFQQTADSDTVSIYQVFLVQLVTDTSGQLVDTVSLSAVC